MHRPRKPVIRSRQKVIMVRGSALTGAEQSQNEQSQNDQSQNEQSQAAKSRNEETQARAAIVGSAPCRRTGPRQTRSPGSKAT